MRDTHYIALIHKEPDLGYGVSFPDVPGIVAVAGTMDEAIGEAAAALDFAVEGWSGDLPVPRSLDQLRQDADFQTAAADAVVAVIRPSAAYYAAAE